MLLVARLCAAYSALTHEAIVDAAWDDSIVPLLRERFPGATEDELREAHAYAYGGCIIQDMGYYPFGSALFTELVHYVRSGDFVVALVNESQSLNDYAFALGALEHYVADDAGHPLAINHVVPLLYPDLRRKFGNTVTYEDDPPAHLRVEFGFDVLQVARGRYTSEAHKAFIGFKVATQLLEDAFFTTYGLQVSDLFASEDLAIGTYRRTVSQLIPEATQVAWELKQDEITQAMPGIRREQFVYSLSRASYEKEWGTAYERPGCFAKFMATVLSVVPKIGPFAPLAFRPPTPEAERLFADSFTASVERYRVLLAEARPGTLQLSDRNLDTGRPPRAGMYSLLDRAYAQWVERLDDRDLMRATPAMRASILTFYDSLATPIAIDDPCAAHCVRRVLAILRSGAPKESPPE